MKSVSELFDNVLNKVTDDIYVLDPAEVVNVSANGNYVDVKIFINDDEPDMVLYNVPIQRPETQRAYIYLGIKKGDKGTLKFFDRSVEGYLHSDFDYNSDDRQHNINDRCFELGFVPDKEAFVYPTNKEIEIGLKNSRFKLSADNFGSLIIETLDAKIKTKGVCTIEANSGVQFTTPDVNISGNLNVATGESAVVPAGSVTLSFSNGILTGVS